jgi:3,4-dihydroxy 2-butanone 4-phosphate synthase/GTP cyclohydrolase II
VEDIRLAGSASTFREERPAPSRRPQRTSGYAPVEDAIAALARGEIIVVVDDPDRENEGDFVMAAEKVTAEAVNFMVTNGRGLLCVALGHEIVDNLDLPPMAADAEPGGTAFTVSIDLKNLPTTGISAAARARCIHRAVAADACPGEFRRPGHVFPLRARPGGVLERAGHTEAAVDLARLAGMRPGGVICEIMNADGTMARRPDLLQVARRHGMCMISIEDLIEYQQRPARQIVVLAKGRVPTRAGEFTAVCFGCEGDELEHVALLYGNPERATAPLVRIHSECLTGDAFGSLRCDCGDQLQRSMELIASDGAGLVVYLRGHEGRGIGLMHKLQAYTLQDAGADTVEANQQLGLPVDARSYGTAAEILHALGIASVRLLTNNPAKIIGLEEHGIKVSERVPLQTAPTPESLRYLQTKRDKLAHDLLALERFELSA